MTADDPQFSNGVTAAFKCRCQPTILLLLKSDALGRLASNLLGLRPSRHPLPLTMSSSGFPQLLRQTNFASFDPNIARVYTSTRSSVRKHGDWGFKKPIYRQKGPRYVRISKLDAGGLLGSDWRSAEQEARFIKSYGNGRVLWTDKEDYYSNMSMEQSLWDDSEFKPPEPKKNVDLMADVNNMTEIEFTKYMEKVKLFRDQYLAGKLNHLRPETLDRLRLDEDRTMVNLSVRGHVNNKDITNFQAGLTKADLGKKDNKTVISTPHEVHGIAYSRLPSSSATVNPLLYHPGRAVERPNDNRSPRARAMRPNALGLNQNWVVSLGGIGAMSNIIPGRISSAHTHLLHEGVDFERKDRARGSGTFRITRAQITEPPKVVGLDLDSKSETVVLGRGVKPKPLTPLNTFNFDVKVDVVGDEVPQMVRDYGSRDWVSGKDQPVSREDGDAWRDDIFGNGRSRSGVGSRSFEKWEAQREDTSRNTLSTLIGEALKRINERKAQEKRS